LKPKCEESVSEFAFNCNLRHYSKGPLLLAYNAHKGTTMAGAVQVDPGFSQVDPGLAFRNFQLLKLKHHELLSNFASST